MARSTSLGQRLITHVRREVNRSYGRRDAFRRMYLEEPEGCVPDNMIGDDLLLAIRGKFYWPMDSVRQQLHKEFGDDRAFSVYIDPDYQDSTFAILTFHEKDVLFSYSRKPWHFWWSNLKAMEKELLEWHRTAQQNFIQAAGIEKKSDKLHMYLASFELISGEYGQPFYHIFEAKNKRQLENKIRRYLQNYYPSGGTYENGMWRYHNSEVAVKDYGWEEILDSQQLIEKLKA